jgi:hypothetical protein
MWSSNCPDRALDRESLSGVPQDERGQERNRRHAEYAEMERPASTLDHVALPILTRIN